mmetsp:Transcript_16283/g.48509  ORF Transcript_16283/g.48509 Transcript_16283/m.48509 type:complete len:277 (-) Transcript_16283:459-1289(-)
MRLCAAPLRAPRCAPPQPPARHCFSCRRRRGWQPAYPQAAPPAATPAAPPAERPAAAVDAGTRACPCRQRGGAFKTRRSPPQQQPHAGGVSHEGRWRMRRYGAAAAGSAVMPGVDAGTEHGSPVLLSGAPEVLNGPAVFGRRQRRRQHQHSCGGSAGDAAPARRVPGVCAAAPRRTGGGYAASEAASAGLAVVTLALPGGLRTEVIAPRGMTILAAAERAGVPLPCSCRNGSCTACCGRVVSGGFVCSAVCVRKALPACHMAWKKGTQVVSQTACV